MKQQRYMMNSKRKVIMVELVTFIEKDLNMFFFLETQKAECLYIS
jgi:hypothetical protein